VFRDRADAGSQLAAALEPLLASDPHALILALPRGGVPVGYQIASRLHLTIDAFPVRKIGMPGEEELALGAVAPGGVRVLNQDLISYLRVSAQVIDQIAEREQRELQRREELYRPGQPPPAIQGRTVLLVDDGLATGATMLAATRAVRTLAAKRVIVAVPVGARDTCQLLRDEGNEVLCLSTPHPFTSVGTWYENFAQVSDQDVRVLLDSARGLNA
jgi:predicted phosphoribosyltransferase